MTFLAMIIGVLLLHYRGGVSPQHWDGWWHRLRLGIYARVASPGWRLAWLVLFPALVAGWVLDWLRPALFGLPWIILAALVLWYSFGRRDFTLLCNRYRAHLQESDYEGAYLFLQDALPDAMVTTPDSPGAFHRQAVASLLYEGYQRWFPVLLYFLLLGPAGALAYRLLVLAMRNDRTGPGRVVRHWLDWLPVRLLALTFAITGDFIRSRDALLDSFASGTPAMEVLQQVGRAAAGPPSADDELPGEVAAVEVAEQAALLSRSAATWVVLAALVTLLG